MDKNGGLLAFSLLLKVLKMASMAINIIYLSLLNKLIICPLQIILNMIQT